MVGNPILTAYRVDFGGLWWTNRPPPMSGLNSKTTLVDSGGRSTLCLAVRRSGVRIPSGPPPQHLVSIKPPGLVNRLNQRRLTSNPLRLGPVARLARWNPGQGFSTRPIYVSFGVRRGCISSRRHFNTWPWTVLLDLCGVPGPAADAGHFATPVSTGCESSHLVVKLVVGGTGHYLNSEIELGRGVLDLIRTHRDRVGSPRFASRH